MSGAASSVSVIIPAYNEEANILESIPRALTVLRELFDDFELILIDDCSTDHTGELAEQLAADNPEIRLLHNPVNVGQGASLVRGFREAKKDLVIHDAMDYPFDLADPPKMIAELDGVNVVVAARTQRAGYTFYRHFLSMVNVTLLRMLFSVRLRDFNFVQLFRRNVLEAIEIECTSTAFLTPQMIIRARDKDFRVREVTIGIPRPPARRRRRGQAQRGALQRVGAAEFLVQ